MNGKNIDKRLHDAADDIAAGALKARRKARRSIGRARASAGAIADEVREPLHAIGTFARQHPLESAAIVLAGAWLARWLFARRPQD